MKLLARIVGFNYFVCKRLTKSCKMFTAHVSLPHCWLLTVTALSLPLTQTPPPCLNKDWSMMWTYSDIRKPFAWREKFHQLGQYFSYREMPLQSHYETNILSCLWQHCPVLCLESPSLCATLCTDMVIKIHTEQQNKKPGIDAVCAMLALIVFNFTRWTPFFLLDKEAFDNKKACPDY